MSVKFASMHRIVLLYTVRARMHTVLTLLVGMFVCLFVNRPPGSHVCILLASRSITTTRE